MLPIFHRWLYKLLAGSSLVPDTVEGNLSAASKFFSQISDFRPLNFFCGQ